MPGLHDRDITVSAFAGTDELKAYSKCGWPEGWSLYAIQIGEGKLLYHQGRAGMDSTAMDGAFIGASVLKEKKRFDVQPDSEVHMRVDVSDVVLRTPNNGEVTVSMKVTIHNKNHPKNGVETEYQSEDWED